MLRSCLIALAGWVLLVVLYAGWLWSELPPPMHMVGPLLMGTIVWFGLVMVYGARNELNDWRAQNRMARGEQPRDGDLVSAVGTIRPAWEALQSPVSGRECVLYSYTAGVVSGGAKAYAGFGMTRCSVNTNYGQIHLGTFPVLEGFTEERGDDGIAEAYLRSATFEDVMIAGLVKRMLGVHSQAPPVKLDLRMPMESTTIENLKVEERIVAPGDTVTAIGRYVATSNSIIGGPREGGYLRLFRGGDAKRVSSFPGKAVRSVIVGLVIVAAANAGMWWLLQRMPR